MSVFLSPATVRTSGRTAALNAPYTSIAPTRAISTPQFSDDDLRDRSVQRLSECAEQRSLWCDCRIEHRTRQQSGHEHDPFHAGDDPSHRVPGLDGCLTPKSSCERLTKRPRC